jgi:hypothetical protein
MNKITEGRIEKFAIEPLEHQGCQYIYTSSITRKLIKFLPLGETEERVMQ